MSAFTATVRSVQQFHYRRLKRAHGHRHWRRIAELYRLRELPDSRQAAHADALRRLAVPGLSLTGQGTDRLVVELRGEILAVPAFLADAIASAPAVTLDIDSSGGDDDATRELLAALRKSGEVEVRAGDYCASAASLLVACAPGRRSMPRDGVLVFHGPACAVMGDARYLREAARNMASRSGFWADQLAARTGMPRASANKILSGRVDYAFDGPAALAWRLVDELRDGATDATARG